MKRSLAEYVWLRVAHKVVTELLSGATVSEDLTGTEEFILISLTWMLARGFSYSSCEPFHRADSNMAARSLRASDLREKQRMHVTETVAPVPFITLSWKWHNIIYAKSCWSHRPTLMQCGKGSHKVWNTRCGDHRDYLGAGYLTA